MLWRRNINTVRHLYINLAAFSVSPPWCLVQQAKDCCSFLVWYSAQPRLCHPPFFTRRFRHGSIFSSSCLESVSHCGTGDLPHCNARWSHENYLNSLPLSYQKLVPARAPTSNPNSLFLDRPKKCYESWTLES